MRALVFDDQAGLGPHLKRNGRAPRSQILEGERDLSQLVDQLDAVVRHTQAVQVSVEPATTKIGAREVRVAHDLDPTHGRVDPRVEVESRSDAIAIRIRDHLDGVVTIVAEREVRSHHFLQSSRMAHDDLRLHAILAQEAVVGRRIKRTCLRI